MANPLTLLMPIVPGTSLADIGGFIVASQKAIDEALSSIGTVHYARFLILDASKANLQPGMSPPPSDSLVLGIITEYDGAFDPYISDFANKIGDVFNGLMKFVVGGSALIPVQQHLAQFTAYIKANDASQNPPNNARGLYEAYPFTVQQILANGPSS